MYIITKSFNHKPTNLLIVVELEFHTIADYRKVEEGFKFRVMKLCETVHSPGDRLVVLEKILDKLIEAGYSVREISTVEHSDRISLVPTIKRKLKSGG